MALTEQEFTDQLVGEKGLATILGYEAAHFRPGQNRRGHWQTPVSGELGKGWPDWVFVSVTRRRFLLRELKTDLGELSVDQRRVLDVLAAAGVDAGVWRPRDLVSGRIERELRR